MIQTEIGKDINKAKLYLAGSQVVAIPTETVYGLAANGHDPAAVTKIFKAKKRPLSNPLILHYKNAQAAFNDAIDIPEQALLLAKTFWPGPLTMLLPKKNHVPDTVTAGKHRVAVRVPNHPLTMNLLESLDFPLAAPSANLYGCISPTSADHVLNQLKNSIPYILDGGKCKKGIESTIVGFDDGEVVLYRLGGIDLEALEKCLNKKISTYKNSKVEEEPLASGMVKHHYAPKTPMHHINNKSHQMNLKKCGFIGFNKIDKDIPTENQFLLSKNGDLKEAASQLYASFHMMDGKNHEAILIEFVPEIELGRSINDRIRRAIQKNKA
ncbi:MAG: L-threonylcarbamoyladenylate synthase [Crocinitomicaceae bacterium]|tara:strand:+ start:3530 stop:4504 length:975 start_codon:yes stop_codon:yes gene_type:complete